MFWQVCCPAVMEWFWRIEDGVGLGMRPRGVFRNGPELRLFCRLTGPGISQARETLIDLRLPADPELNRARYLTIEASRRHTSSVLSSNRFAEGPLAVSGNWETHSILARVDDRVWADLKAEASNVSVNLRSAGGDVIWARTYSSRGIERRADKVLSNCVGALQPLDQ